MSSRLSSVAGPSLLSTLPKAPPSKKYTSSSSKSTNQAKRYHLCDKFRSTHQKTWFSTPSRRHPSRTSKSSLSVKIRTINQSKPMDCVSVWWNPCRHHPPSRIFTRTCKAIQFWNSTHPNTETSQSGPNKECSFSTLHSRWKKARQTHMQNADGKSSQLRSLTWSTRTAKVWSFCFGANRHRTRLRTWTRTSITFWKHPIHRLWVHIKGSWRQVIYLVMNLEHFSECNALLVKDGRAPIDWNL